MDPSAPAAQNVQNQSQTDQSKDSVTPVSTVQPQTAPAQQATTKIPVPPPPPLKRQQQISISGGGIEEGASMIVSDNPEDDEDDEDEIQVAPQEKKNLGVMGQGDEEQEDEQQKAAPAVSVDASDEIEVRPTVPEVITSSPEVEKLIEITPPEKPKISEELKSVVTHSGPGIIDVTQSKVPSAKIPVTYAQALTEEEKIKSNKLHNSKFWFLEKIKYLWRKVNPNIEIALKKQAVKTLPANQVVPAKPVQNVQTQEQEVTKIDS